MGGEPVYGRPATGRAPRRSGRVPPPRPAVPAVGAPPHQALEAVGVTLLRGQAQHVAGRAVAHQGRFARALVTSSTRRRWETWLWSAPTGPRGGSSRQSSSTSTSVGTTRPSRTSSRASTARRRADRAAVPVRRTAPSWAPGREGEDRRLPLAGAGRAGELRTSGASIVLTRAGHGRGPKGTASSRKCDLGTVGELYPDVGISHRQGSGKERPAPGKGRSAAGTGCRKADAAGWDRGTSCR